MSRKTAKILGGIFLLIAVTALIVLLVTLLHKDSPETSKDTPTKAPTPSISVPEGSVLVWRLAEVTSESNSGERYVSSRYEYDERGLCISSKEYYDDNEPETECEFSYDEDTKCTTVTVLEHKTVSMGALSAMDSTDNKSVYVLNPEGVKLSEERYDFTDGAYELRYKYEYHILIIHSVFCGSKTEKEFWFKIVYNLTIGISNSMVAFINNYIVEFFFIKQFQ